MTHRRDDLYHHFKEKNRDHMYDDLNFQANLTLLMHVVPSKIVNDAPLKALLLDTFKGKMYWWGKMHLGEEEAIHPDYFCDPDMAKLFGLFLLSCKAMPNKWNEISNVIKEVLWAKGHEYSNSQFIYLKCTSQTRKQWRNQFQELLPTTEGV